MVLYKSEQEIWVSFNYGIWYFQQTILDPEWIMEKAEEKSVKPIIVGQ